MKYTCKLTVKNAVLSKKTLLLTTGNSAHVTLSNASGKLIDDKLITWTSASKSVASVSAGGTVKGLKAGSTTVYAKYKGKTYSVKITVKNASLTKTSSKIELGKTLRISLKGADKKAISDNQIKWKSADKTIATVSSNGTITAKKVGKTIVSATYRGKTYKCTVTVIRVVCKAKQGCKNYAIAGGDYCKDHTCRLSGCNSPTNYAQWDGTGGNTKYCQNHGCFHSYCTSRKSGTSNYCSSHKCLKSSCDSERKDGKYYCWQHSCRHDGCMSERGTGSLRLYCDYHTCRYNDDGFDCSCESMGSQYGYLCKIHYYCTNPDCNLKRVGKYYCSKHKCRQAGCENANLGASNYYYCRYHH